MPLMPTILPSVRARWVAANAASTSSIRMSPPENHNLGPQSRHAIGWAWNRRSAGSWYSAEQRAHRPKSAIVVVGRAYGALRMIVNRGAQEVQVTNGWQ